MTVDALDLARAGDRDAFRQLIEPYERELQAHCYRMLGSVQDAEDAMQDALLAAWQGLDGVVPARAAPGPEQAVEGPLAFYLDHGGPVGSALDRFAASLR